MRVNVMIDKRRRSPSLDLIFLDRFCASYWFPLVDAILLKNSNPVRK